MNDTTAISKVILALEDAGKSQESIDRLTRLEKRRITTKTVIPKREFLFRMFGKPCFPKGELVALTGKEKSGKTFVTSLLMTLCLRREVLGMERIGDERRSVLWFDTEQSEESTQEILAERIVPMCGTEATDGELPEGLMNVFNVRSEPWRERLPLLEEAIIAYRPDLVVLDGIRDLVDDINDGVLAQEVIERLMHLASECGCCIVCVLHQNKSVEDKSLRGWIGTELANKSFEVYECQKNTDHIFSCRQTRTRKYDIADTLRFTVDDGGIPQPCTLEPTVEVKATVTAATATAAQPRKGKERGPLNPVYVDPRKECGYIVDFRKLFADVVPPGGSMPAGEVMSQATKLAGIEVPALYYRLKAAALKENVLQHTVGPHGEETLTRPLVPVAAPPLVPPPAPPVQGELPF